MSFQLIVGADAERDLEEAFDWYENESPGLGVEFVLAARSAIQKITERPLSYPIALGITRRFVRERFPYSLFFVVVDDTVTVTACIHQRRHPRVWKDRK